jgi:polar amino acid transport system substrate-binding protein
MRLNQLFILLLISFSCLAVEPISVSVGMYPFAPFVELKGSNGEAGMTVDLVAALNKTQKKYHFNTVLIPPKRRYQSFNDGHYDVIFYESKSWGWQDIKVDTSHVYQKGGEIYVALKKPGRDQSYFNEFHGKRMIGILGFHYGFANFNADEEFLRNNFNMLITSENDRNMNLLLKERGDLAVVTKAYLQRFLLEHPDEAPLFLISEKLDQEYNHTALLRPGISPNIDEINTMLTELKQAGEMRKILDKYGLK